MCDDFIIDELDENINGNFSNKLLDALKESEDIINGKIECKKYDSFDELFDDIE